MTAAGMTVVTTAGVATAMTAAGTTDADVTITGDTVTKSPDTGNLPRKNSHHPPM